MIGEIYKNNNTFPNEMNQIFSADVQHIVSVGKFDLFKPEIDIIMTTCARYKLAWNIQVEESDKASESMPELEGENTDGDLDENEV